MKEVMYDSTGISHARIALRRIVDVAPTQCQGCPNLRQLSENLAMLVAEQDIPIKVAQDTVNEKINEMTCRYGLLAIEGCIGDENPRCSLGITPRLYT